MKATTRSEPDIRSLLKNGFNEDTARSLYAQQARKDEVAREIDRKAPATSQNYSAITRENP